MQLLFGLLILKEADGFIEKTSKVKMTIDDALLERIQELEELLSKSKLKNFNVTENPFGIIISGFKM